MPEKVSITVLKAAAVIYVFVIAVITVTAEYRVKKAADNAGRNAAAEVERLHRRVYALEAENDALETKMLFMAEKAETAAGMAEDLLVYTRLSYPMKSEEIIEELASYQKALLALLDKLTEAK
jgi:cell division protein FtsB